MRTTCPVILLVLFGFAARCPAGVADCNGNGVPDDFEHVVTFASGDLTPLHFGSPQSFEVVAPPAATADAVLQFRATADLNNETEFVDIRLNDVPVGSLFVTDGSACAPEASVAEIVLSAAVFNGIVAGGDLTIEMLPSDSVNILCEVSTIAVTLRYLTADDSGGVQMDDCNANGVLDACDIATTLSTDCDRDQRPDECQPDADGDGTIDVCDACPDEPELTAPSEPDRELTCDDGIDNDCDDLTDGDDLDCNLPVCTQVCGDLDADDTVTLEDFATFALCFGQSVVATPACVCADLDTSTTVDLIDFAAFAALFGQTPTNLPPDCP